jgi:hypothetical protein
MATRRASQKDKHSKHKRSEHVEHRDVEHEANLGQKQASLDKEKEAELSHMGEMSRAAEKE